MRNSSIAPSHVVNILSRGFSLGKKTFYSSHRPLCRPHKLRIQAREPGRAGAGGCPRLSAWPSASHSPASPCRLTSARTTLTTASGGCSPSWQGRWVSPRAPRHALWPMRRETWSSSSGGLQREGGEETKGTEAERICSRDGSAPSRRPSPAPSPGLRLSWGRALGSSASPGALAFLFSVRPN